MEFGHDYLRRIERLEEQHRRLMLRQEPETIHEVITVSRTPHAGGAAPMATHAAGEELRNWLVPLKFTGTIDIARASAYVLRQGGGIALFGISIYRAAPSGRKQVSETTKMAVRACELVANLGTASTASASAVRINIDTQRPVRLDSRRGIYLVGFSVGSASDYWWCPDGGLARTVRTSCIRTSPAGASVGAAPATLTTTIETLAPPCPWIVLRSEEGIRLFGDPDSD